MRWMMAMAAVLAAGGVLMPVASGQEKKDLPRGVDRVQVLYDQLDEELLSLMMATGPEAGKDVRVRGAKISYRVVLRDLYQAAEKEKNGQRRIELLLRADTLRNGSATFDAVAEKIPEIASAAAANAPAGQTAQQKALGAVKSFAAFEDVTRPGADGRVKPPLDAVAALQGVAAWESVGDVVAWPVEGRKKPEEVATQRRLPAVAETILALQQAKISPALRQELQAILTPLQAEMAKPETAGAAEAWYRTMLDAVRLGEELAGNTTLDYGTRVALNKQLMMGLVFFKDPRTRGMGAARLAEVGRIADIVKELDRSQLTAEARSVVAPMISQALRKMGRPTGEAAGRKQLEEIRGFVSAYDAMSRAAAGPVSPALKTEWEKVRAAAEKQAETGLKAITLQYGEEKKAATAKADDVPSVKEITARMDKVRENLERLSAMGDVTRAVEALRPGSGGVVERKMVVWARAIAAAPDGTGAGKEAAESAITDARAYGRAVALLTTLERELPDMVSPELTRVTGGQWERVLKAFQAPRGKLLAALTATGTITEKQVAEVEKEAMPLRAAAALAATGGLDKPLGRINAWGAWELSEKGVAFVKREADIAVRAAFNKDDPAANDPEESPLLSLEETLGVIRGVMLLDAAVSPKLMGSGLSLVLAQVGRPSEGAVMGDQAEALARASVLAEEAAANGTLRRDAAKWRMVEVAKVLGEVK